MTRRRRWHPTPVLLPGKSHGWRSLVGCSPWGREESETTERLHFHFSLSCIGEGNGNPLQCSCLENPRDGGAWWGAVYGVTQSQTWLKWLSSSSSSRGVTVSSISHMLTLDSFLTYLLIAQDTLVFYRGQSEKFQTEFLIVRKCYGEGIQTSCVYVVILCSCQLTYIMLGIPIQRKFFLKSLQNS